MGSITLIRGKIRNKDHVPIKDFSGLRFGKITPTDFDGFLDFRNKLFILIELKFGTKQLDIGQRLALERACDSWARDGKMSVILLAHYNTGPKEEVLVHTLPVSLIRRNGEWRKPLRELNVRQAIDQLLIEIKKSDYGS